MNKIFLIVPVIVMGLGVSANAEISVEEAATLELRAQKIRQELNIHTPTEEERKVARIRQELNLDFDTSSKATLLGQDSADTVASLGTHQSDEGILDSTLSMLQNTISTETKEEDEYSFSSSLNSFYDSVGLDAGESFGMPSLFGLNEKKEEQLFGMDLLGDIQDTGTFIYKGMKYGGTSAELSSGMMYRSSKMYNTMFGMFDDSPFNVFEEEDETSIFDVFEGGNKILDLFD